MTKEEDARRMLMNEVNRGREIQIELKHKKAEKEQIVLKEAVVHNEKIWQEQEEAELKKLADKKKAE